MSLPYQIRKFLFSHVVPTYFFDVVLLLAKSNCCLATIVFVVLPQSIVSLTTGLQIVPWQHLWWTYVCMVYMTSLHVRAVCLPSWWE